MLLQLQYTLYDKYTITRSRISVFNEGYNNS